MSHKAVIMDQQSMQRAISRIAQEIIENNNGVENIAIIGIHTRGVPFAKRLINEIQNIEGKSPEFGNLDITFYRDDLSLLSEHPVINGSYVDFLIEGKTVILVDDVLYTGRTVRAAIEALFELGRPKKVQLAVMINRGHRELPIQPDYVGRNVPTSRNEHIKVNFTETDEEDIVVISEREVK